MKGENVDKGVIGCGKPARIVAVKIVGTSVVVGVLWKPLYYTVDKAGSVPDPCFKDVLRRPAVTSCKIHVSLTQCQSMDPKVRSINLVLTCSYNSPHEW